MKVCLLSIGVLLSLLCSGQKHITYKQLCADVDYLFRTVDSLHPNLYWHTPKERVDSAVAEMKEKFRGRDSIDVRDFAMELAQMNHFFDYHTTMTLVYRFDEKGDTVFPRVTYQGGKFYLKGTGKEILSINGVGIDAIRRAWQNTYSPDFHPGYSEFYLNYVLDFQKVLMYLGIYAPYRVEYREGGACVSCMEAGVSFAAMRAEVQAFLDVFWDNANPYPYSFEIYPDSSVAIIRLTKCVETNHAHNFFLMCFHEILEHDIQHVFVDVSRNTGGTTAAFNDIFNTFMTTKFFYRYRHDRLEKKLNDKGEWELDLASPWYPVKGFRRKGLYKRKLFVYQSPLTCSAAPFLGEVLKAVGAGILVGTDTEPQDPSYGNVKSFILPYSGLTRTCASTCDFNMKPDYFLTQEGGLRPDISYPFLIERRLGVEDCMKIVRMSGED